MKSTLVIATAVALALAGCAGSTTASKAESSNSTSPTSAAEATPADEPTIEDSSPEPSGVPTGKVGDTLEITTGDGNGEITLTQVKVVRPGQYDTKAENGRYIQIVLTARSTSNNFSINPFDFALVDDEGSEYDQTFISAAKGADLKARTLHEGQRTKGSILYDAPKGALILAYRGGGFGAEDVGAWRLGR
jgi:hypothetical protein